MATDAKPSNDLRKLISASVVRAHPSSGTVRGDDLDILKAVLSGTRKPDFAINRKRALELLARSESSPEVTRLLGTVVADEDADTALRTTAARLVRLMPSDAAEKVLIPALTTTDARLHRALLRSLGETGGKAAQKALNEAPDTPEVTTARLLVALRSGAHKGSLSEALDLSRLQVEAEPLPKKEASALLEAIQGRAFGVPLSTQRAMCFDCRTDRQAVLLAQSFDLKSPGIVGAVLQYHDDPSEAELRYVVLYSYSRSQADIAVMTPSGRVDYAGVGTLNRGRVTFDLRDADDRAVPVVAQIQASARSLKLSLTISERRAARHRARRRAQAILTTDP